MDPTEARYFSLFQRTQTGSTAHPASYSRVQGLHTTRVKRLGCEVDQSPSGSDEVKKESGYTSAPPMCHPIMDRGNSNFTLPFVINSQMYVALLCLESLLIVNHSTESRCWDIQQRKLIAMKTSVSAGLLQSYHPWRLQICNVAELSKGENIVKWIKGQRISWLGQLVRMKEGRMPKKIFTQELEGTRRRGRPRRG
jgi:hypothetical protein